VQAIDESGIRTLGQTLFNFQKAHTSRTKLMEEVANLQHLQVSNRKTCNGTRITFQLDDNPRHCKDSDDWTGELMELFGQANTEGIHLAI
jgi:hypothetical protein